MADMFIKIDGIAGESQDLTHPGEIEVSSWEWKISAPATSGSGGGAGKATASDFSFAHQIDRSSPNLMRFCLEGRRISKAVFSMRKAGGVPLDFCKITMSDVVVTKCHPSAIGSLNDEHVTLSFTKVKQEYVLQNTMGGSAGTVCAESDIKKNVSEN
ncbi:Hcp family type VI secretion system effector [Caballeronia grimmiae]|uniref:Hcp1 family type VI secretion system effector n=1 Tax=Caballeronia grimmiae TaxID=1071679 RepID=A0A069NNE1_9BURK|nr:type VI secretion system tube protein Hcp [Caballeronia grimmiae]KDR29998.1 Hcp1 family type VI secretion system effector [Caballeronia grimmiae]GGD91758.1 hypothetical protein GCM10010985_53120 [Caballeronia grimmiae]